MNLTNYGFMTIVLLLVCFTTLSLIDRIVRFPEPGQAVSTVQAQKTPAQNEVSPAVQYPIPAINYTRPRNGFVPPPPPVSLFP